jgi:hypothetical protein
MTLPEEDGGASLLLILFIAAHGDFFALCCSSYSFSFVRIAVEASTILSGERPKK